MVDFFTRYTLVDIIVYTALLVVMIRKAYEFFEWYREKNDKHYANKTALHESLKGFQEQFKEQKELNQEVLTTIHEIQTQMSNISNNVDLLISSDKDAIKSFITEKHHYFCAKGSIDDHSLDTIELRYGHYKQEGGNSYIKDLMEEIRDLPHEEVLNLNQKEE